MFFNLFFFVCFFYDFYIHLLFYKRLNTRNPNKDLYAGRQKKNNIKKYVKNQNKKKLNELNKSIVLNEERKE